MKTYNLKSVIRRGSMLTAAFVIAGASLLSAAPTFADALNPLTDRSLTLSSSAPGWDFKDGSGNATYADPNSGANGKQTGNTFAFKVSTDSSASGTNAPVKALTFQYCTAPAGTCTAPGNNVTSGSSGSFTRSADSTADEKSDLNVAYSAVSGEPTNGETVNSATPVFDSTSGNVTSIPKKDGSQGHFIVYTKDDGATTWTQNTGWEMAVDNNEDNQNPVDFATTGKGTGKNNFITLTNSAGGLSLKSTGQVKIVFFGTNDNYITNPGAGAFFVKINTWNDLTNRTSDELVDGGVTVANVMNLGISIQTKVLETMDFSVGTVDPYTLSAAQQLAAPGARTSHGTCDPILNTMTTSPTEKKNTLMLGSETNENSLSTDTTYSTHSYFRLSSNASAGATVYYSGVTLSNTVGDKIKPINIDNAPGQKTTASRGTEQFGLALATTGPSDKYKIDYKTEREQNHIYENGADNAAAGLDALNNWKYDAVPANAIASTGTGVDPSWTPTGGQKFPQLTVFNGNGVSGDPDENDVALAPEANYSDGAGVVNPVANVYTGTNAQFAFDNNSNLIPTPIASESNKVVDCASAKVRYIANIAATTPAGIYTTKINFIASPQY